jgi:hypothetical protein
MYTSIFLSISVLQTLKDEFIMLAKDSSSSANFRMPTYLHVNIGKIYTNFAPQIEVKKLHKFIAILIDKDNNIWTLKSL